MFCIFAAVIFKKMIEKLKSGIVLSLFILFGIMTSTCYMTCADFYITDNQNLISNDDDISTNNGVINNYLLNIKSDGIISINDDFSSKIKNKIYIIIDKSDYKLIKQIDYIKDRELYSYNNHLLSILQPADYYIYTLERIQT